MQILAIDSAIRENFLKWVAIFLYVSVKGLSDWFLSFSSFYRELPWFHVFLNCNANKLIDGYLGFPRSLE